MLLDNEDESLRVLVGLRYSHCGSKDRITFLEYIISGFALTNKVEMPLISASPFQNLHETHSTDQHNWNKSDYRVGDVS
ncbi:uncharacterized protein LOC129901065 isoform X3 [Solanum dulcamara]|uniref:uncharacterized protein LOC129901065 isoform X3 n=1 Tax=Solanum dulcamara TaxID=45834 RepID=UPI0024856C82|nr:uncharacterized protein LOC129901065 isoform X3 [Solanum dulcamara]